MVATIRDFEDLLDKFYDCLREYYFTRQLTSKLRKEFPEYMFRAVQGDRKLGLVVGLNIPLVEISRNELKKSDKKPMPNDRRDNGLEEFYPTECIRLTGPKNLEELMAQGEQKITPFLRGVLLKKGLDFQRPGYIKGGGPYSLIYTIPLSS